MALLRRCVVHGSSVLCQPDKLLKPSPDAQSLGGFLDGFAVNLNSPLESAQIVRNN